MFVELTTGANIALPTATAVVTLAGEGLDVSVVLLGPDRRVRSRADPVFYSHPSHDGATAARSHRHGAAGEDPSQLTDPQLYDLPMRQFPSWVRATRGARVLR